MEFALDSVNELTESNDDKLVKTIEDSNVESAVESIAEFVVLPVVIENINFK